MLNRGEGKVDAQLDVVMEQVTGRFVLSVKLCDDDGGTSRAESRLDRARLAA